MRFRRIALLLGVLLVACGGEEEPPASGTPVPAAEVDLERKLAVIHAGLPALESRRGEWTRGDVTGRLQAHLRDGRLVFVDETVELGGSGTARRRYYFEDDRLFYTMSREERAGTAGRGPTLAELSVRFTPAGSAIDARKAVAGDPVDVTPDDVRGVRLAVERIRAALDPDDAQRIRFRGDTWSAMLTGAAAREPGRSYVVDIDAGQTLRVTVEPDSLRFAVLDPAGITLVDTTGFWIRELAGGGDHRIRIYSAGDPVAYTFRIELR